MSSVVAVHAPFEMVQRNVFTPELNPVTPEVGDEGVVTVALPAITVQFPVPTKGVFPASVETSVAQINWSGPALDTVGKSSNTMVMSSVEGVQGAPFVIVQRNVFVPMLKPVTPDELEVGVVTVALPAIIVHIPDPYTGKFPASVAVVAQTAWSMPASDVVGAV